MHPSVFFLATAASSASTSPPSRPNPLAQAMLLPPQYQPHQPSSCSSSPCSSSPQPTFASFHGEETSSFHYFQDQQQQQTRMPLGQHVHPQVHHPPRLSHPPPWSSPRQLPDMGQRPLLNKENNAEIFNPAVEEICSNLIPPSPTASLPSQPHPHLPSPSFGHPQPQPHLAPSYSSSSPPIPTASYTSFCGHPQAPCPPQLQPKRKSNEGEEDDDSHSRPKRRSFRLGTTERRDGRRLSEQEGEAGDEQSSFSTSGSSYSSFLKSSTTSTTKRSSPQRHQSSPAASLPPFSSTPTNNSQRPPRSSSRKNVAGGQVSFKEGRGDRRGSTTKKDGQRTKRSTAGTHPSSSSSSSSSTPTMTMFEIERQRQAALRRKKGMRAKKRFLKQGPNELDFRLDQHPPPAPSSLPPASSPPPASGPAGRTNSSSSSDSSPPLRRASSFPCEQQQQQPIAAKAKTEGWMGEEKQREEAVAVEAAEQPFYLCGGRNRTESSVGTPTCPPTTVNNSFCPSTPSPAVYAAPGEQPQTIYSVHPLGSGFPVASGRRPQPTVAPQQPSQRQQQLHQLVNASKQRGTPTWR
ncbi:hypothetical protein QOT17_001610 [Balamuthia mandrillaris]